MIRVVIADDQEVIRSGLANLFLNTEVEVVAQLSNGEESLAAAVDKQPDVVLLDIRMPQVDGFQALERLGQLLPDTPVLMISAYDNPTYVGRAKALGAKGYISKGAYRHQFIDAIRALASGGEAWCERSRRASDKIGEQSILTKRENEVLQQLALGLSNNEIGAALHISTETVKEHVQRICKKLGVSGRTQAAVWAVRNQQSE